MQNKLAYEVNGSVYFDVNAYVKKGGTYGELSGRKTDELFHNTRELEGQSEKRNPLDFALWKKPQTATSCAGLHHGASDSLAGTWNAQ